MSTPPKKLNVAKLFAEQMMTTQVESILISATVREATLKLLTRKISGLPVVNQNRIFITVVTEIDLMKFIAANGLDLPLNQFVSQLPSGKELITVQKQDSFKDVFKCFLLHPIKRVFVLDSVGNVQGVISRRDVLRSFIGSEPDLSGE